MKTFLTVSARFSVDVVKAGVAIALVVCTPLLAETYNYTPVNAYGFSGSWDTPSNWTTTAGIRGAGYPSAPGDTALVFGGGTNSYDDPWQLWLNNFTDTVANVGHIAISISNSMTIGNSGVGKYLVFNNPGQPHAVWALTNMVPDNQAYVNSFQLGTAWDLVMVLSNDLDVYVSSVPYDYLGVTYTESAGFAFDYDSIVVGDYAINVYGGGFLVLGGYYNTPPNPAILTTGPLTLHGTYVTLNEGAIIYPQLVLRSVTDSTNVLQRSTMYGIGAPPTTDPTLTYNVDFVLDRAYYIALNYWKTNLITPGGVYNRGSVTTRGFGLFAPQPGCLIQFDCDVRGQDLWKGYSGSAGGDLEFVGSLSPGEENVDLMYIVGLATSGVCRVGTKNNRVDVNIDINGLGDVAGEDVDTIVLDSIGPIDLSNVDLTLIVGRSSPDNTYLIMYCTNTMLLNDFNSVTWMGSSSGRVIVVSNAVYVADISSKTNAPFVEITNTAVNVTCDVASYIIAGTNNVNVVGNMWMQNANSGGVAVSFNRNGLSFITPPVTLNVGTNVIWVYGTNVYGIAFGDSITVTRGGIGTGTPYVDITNATPPILSYDVTVFTLGITNNAHVVGTRRWTNAFTSASGALVNNQATISLGVGANLITVIGTNEWNVSVSDNITVTRGGIGTGTPYVDITNVLTGPVNNSVSVFTLAGTNNPQVVGTMCWVNTANGGGGTFDASPNWQTAVPLAVGINPITIFGTNLWRLQTNDTIIVIRLPGAPANVSATDGAFPNKVRVTFAASVGASKYMVYRASNSTPTNFAALSGEIAVTTYDDTTVTVGQNYYYAVQAGSPFGWSELSASDSGFALLAINAGEWKYKAGAKLNKKGKLVGKDMLKGSSVNPTIKTWLEQGWRIGFAGLVNGSLTNWNGPYSLTPNKSKKMWQVKDPAKGTPKVCFIKYSVNDKKGDKLYYQLWTNMPADKVVYILPTNLLFGTSKLLNEKNKSESPVQFHSIYMDGRNLMPLLLTQQKLSHMKIRCRNMANELFHDDLGVLTALA
ncbi:MAG: hypothetical protein NTV22_01720 [bacterium]|nr:hypothetical protein [bacterium]